MKPPDEQANQLVRIEKMLTDDAKLKADAKEWLQRRKNILKQLGVNVKSNPEL